MLSITEEEGPRFPEDGAPGCSGGGPQGRCDAPIMSITNEDGEERELSQGGDEGGQDCEYTWRYWEDEDDVYQEFEELDFEALADEADARSIASDDSFYPPDDAALLGAVDSPEPVSFFKACCNNNTIIVKIMIRQGVTEEEVRETDRNRRVGGFHLCTCAGSNRCSAGLCPQTAVLLLQLRNSLSEMFCSAFRSSQSETALVKVTNGLLRASDMDWFFCWFYWASKPLLTADQSIQLQVTGISLVQISLVLMMFPLCIMGLVTEVRRVLDLDQCC